MKRLFININTSHTLGDEDVLYVDVPHAEEYTFIQERNNASDDGDHEYEQPVKFLDRDSASFTPTDAEDVFQQQHLQPGCRNSSGTRYDSGTLGRADSFRRDATLGRNESFRRDACARKSSFRYVWKTFFNNGNLRV